MLPWERAGVRPTPFPLSAPAQPLWCRHRVPASRPPLWAPLPTAPGLQHQWLLAQAQRMPTKPLEWCGAESLRTWTHAFRMEPLRRTVLQPLPSRQTRLPALVQQVALIQPLFLTAGRCATSTSAPTLCTASVPLDALSRMPARQCAILMALQMARPLVPRDARTGQPSRRRVTSTSLQTGRVSVPLVAAQQAWSHAERWGAAPTPFVCQRLRVVRPACLPETRLLRS